VEIAGTLEGLQPYTIHGSRYVRVYYSHADDPETILQCQLPEEAVDSALKPGDSVFINYLLKNVLLLRSGGLEADGFSIGVAA
jgi:hypothetical protein